jgi:hypothetical protein
MENAQSKSNTDLTNIQRQEQLLGLATNWELQAGRYFVLEQSEKDSLGKKFYHSSGVALANCANELRELVHAEQLNCLQETEI